MNANDFQAPASIIISEKYYNNEEITADSPAPGFTFYEIEVSIPGLPGSTTIATERLDDLRTLHECLGAFLDSRPTNSK